MTAERIANGKNLISESDLTFAERIELYDLLDSLKAALLDVERLDTLDREGVVDFVRIIPAQPGGDIRKRIDKFAARAAIKKEQEG